MRDIYKVAIVVIVCLTLLGAIRSCNDYQKIVTPIETRNDTEHCVSCHIKEGVIK